MGEEKTTGSGSTTLRAEGARRSAPDGPGRPAPWWRGPYAVLVACVLLWAVLVTVRHQWAGDFRLHLATIDGLRRDPLDPRDPMVGAGEGSPYYSPYTVFLAFAGWGVGARTVLEIAGLVNIALLLTGFWRLVGRRAGAFPAVLAVVFTLLLWGTEPRDWSGFLDLYSLSWTLTYPSTFATALMLLTWDVALSWLDRPGGWRRPALLAALCWVIVLTHPFTAINTVIGLVAFALCHFPRLRSALTWASLRWLLAAGAVAVAAVFVWPWSDITTLLGASGDFSEIHRPLIDDITRDWGLPGYLFALIGLPALFFAGRRPLGRELQALFAGALLVLAVGVLVLGNYGYGRVIPAVLLPLHLALAIRLGTATRRVPARVAYGVATFVVCLAGLDANAGGLLRAWDVSYDVLKDWNVHTKVQTPYDALARDIRPGTVVMTNVNWAGRVVNAHGAYTVRPSWPYPFVNEQERRDDVAAFFRKTASPAERSRIADRYDVSCVLAARSTAPMKKGALPGFDTRKMSGKQVLVCRRA
ncbi:hypothetical protein [Actinomadura atramentaria]|uniref:hypothetical protein n=1 Tax=Actinomadura atramentaria TaxID=1990 RepID=UPI0012F869DB|nr:hypothetical protein [Actinomadura atramentaria]